MNYEIIGTLGSILVVCAFCMKGERNIRRVDMTGAFLFVVYGFLIKSFSVAFLNIVLIMIHTYRLIKR